MKKLFLFATLLFTIYGKAQINIGMGQANPLGTNTTFTAGMSVVYPVWVKNYSSTTFSDVLTLYTAVVDSNGNIGPANIVNTYNAGGMLVTIAPNDSISFSLTDTLNISGSGFRIGIDVIVVWPVASSAVTVDSLTFGITITDPSGINKIDLLKEINLFPNPTHTNLTVFSGENLQISSVRMFDLDGKEVTVELNNNSINTEYLKQGVYSIDIEFTNKKHLKTKFIKE